MVRKRTFRVTVEGSVYEVEVEEVTAGTAGTAGTDVTDVADRSGGAQALKGPADPPARPQPSPIAGGAATMVSAPLPGMVLDVKAAEGSTVEVGQVLIILEAMKMENEIVAPRSGVVSKVHVTKGTGVGAGDPLVEIS